MKTVYLAMPLSPVGDETVESNIASAKATYRRLCLMYPEILFLMPWLLNVEVFEDLPALRDIGMRRNFAAIELCDELWYLGPRISQGMRDEGAHALKCDKVLFDMVKFPR